MIGVKSLAVIALAAGAIAIAVVRGDLDLEQLAHRSSGSAFAIGIFAAMAAALVGWSARPGAESRAAVTLSRRGRPALVLEPAPGSVRELPAAVQRVLLVAAFACVALATFTNEATARIAAVPAELTKPSRSEYCHDDEPAAKPTPAPAVEEPPPVDQAGCALVKRAFELGYAKSLGSCAPKQAVAVAPAAAPTPREVREPCTRRQLDEPFTHYAWRRVVDTIGGVEPVASTNHRVDVFRTRLDYTTDLLADIRHSITGTPHASHHLWINLPDPHPRGWQHRFTGEEPCTSLFADLPLWPRWTDTTAASTVVEHVLGQLLFATRFGTSASCSDYTIHWDAPADACTRLAADPVEFLAGEGALASIRDVLDRRRRQLALRALAADLEEAPTIPIPPAARAVTSVACFVVDASVPTVRSVDLVIDGESVAMRELHAPTVRATGRGPIAVYVALALLFGGAPYSGAAITNADRVAAEPPGSLDGGDFPLLELEPLAAADPFLGNAASAPLDRIDILDVYPFESHLFAFIDAFRRIYLPQRGRL